jgi:hypothetical protein
MSEESPLDDYVRKTEEVIKHLKEKKVGDRLDLVSFLEEEVSAVNASTLGWNAWIQHPSIMKLFNENELNEIAEGLRKMSSDFLEFDIKWTKILKERKEAELEKKKKEEKSCNSGGKQYIS